MKIKFAPAKLKYSLAVLILLLGTFAVFATDSIFDQYITAACPDKPG